MPSRESLGMFMLQAYQPGLVQSLRNSYRWATRAIGGALQPAGEIANLLLNIFDLGDDMCRRQDAHLCPLLLQHVEALPVEHNQLQDLSIGVAGGELALEYQLGHLQVAPRICRAIHLGHTRGARCCQALLTVEQRYRCITHRAVDRCVAQFAPPPRLTIGDQLATCRAHEYPPPHDAV